MTKILASCAALALTAVFAMPVSAGATEKRADGVRNAEQTDVSAQRRYRRYGHRYYGPRYRYGYRGYRYGYRPYYSAPYYAYSPYYRPYYGPRVGVGVGPLGFGFGW